MHACVHIHAIDKLIKISLIFDCSATFFLSFLFTKQKVTTHTKRIPPPPPHPQRIAKFSGKLVISFSRLRFGQCISATITPCLPDGARQFPLALKSTEARLCCQCFHSHRCQRHLTKARKSKSATYSQVRTRSLFNNVNRHMVHFNFLTVRCISCACVCVCVRACAHVYVCVCACAPMCMCVCMHMCESMCMCTCAYVHVYPSACV